MNKLLPLIALIAGSIGAAHAQTGPTVQLQAGAVVTLPTGAGLAAIAAGDFNHDNRTDLAVCERTLGQVALYLRSELSAWYIHCKSPLFPIWLLLKAPIDGCEDDVGLYIQRETLRYFCC